MINRNSKGRYEKQYFLNDREIRDRFQVEFNKSERNTFTDIQIFLEQTKDATALKQMAFLGWLSISNQTNFNNELKNTLLINNKNNKRLGIDVITEIENRFQQRIMKIGGNL